MTLAEAGEVFAYWADNPPPHLLLQVIARALGWAPRARPMPADPAALLAAPPPGLAATPSAVPSAELDPAALRDRNRARAAAIARRNAAAG